MTYSYSRRSKIEERRNLRRAFFFVSLTISAIVALFYFGIPIVIKYSSFLTDIKKSSRPIEGEDNTPPAPPRLNPLPEATNSDKIEISGYAEPGSSVLLLLNSKEEEILVNSSGEFSYSYSLSQGTNSISAFSRDASGNESPKIDKVKVKYDTQPPKLEIKKPEGGSKYYGSKQRQIAIEGITEEESLVFINERQVVVENDGTFSLITALLEGENKFIAKAIDKADNETEVSFVLHFSP